MKPLNRFVVLLLSASLPTTVMAQTPGPSSFQVVRPGDNQMACPALIAEINALNGEMQTVQTGLFDMNAEISQESISAAQTSMASSAAMSLGGLAASLIPGAGLALGAAQMLGAASQGAQIRARQAQTLAQMADATAQTTDAANRMVPIGQRIEHLSAVSRANSC